VRNIGCLHREGARRAVLDARIPCTVYIYNDACLSALPLATQIPHIRGSDCPYIHLNALSRLEFLEQRPQRVMSGSESPDSSDPGACHHQTGMESASHTSEESVYYSCSEDSSWDSDQNEGLSWTPASSAFLGATNTALLSSDSETLRVLVCINAARIILAEIMSPAPKVRSLRPFKGEAMLKVCTRRFDTPSFGSYKSPAL
jgi:hypothetical protein